MNGTRMTSGLTGSRIGAPFCEKMVYELKDKTSEIRKIAFPEPREGVVHWSHGVITGMPGSGKSADLDDRVYYAARFYQRFGERLEVIRTDSMNVAIDMANDSDAFKYIQVDDAATHAASIAPYEVKEMMATFQRMRHVLEERVDTDTGAVIVDFGWQRWKEVYPTFRNGTTQVFKTGMAEPDDDNLILRSIGETAHEELHRIWNRMVKGDQEIKSTSIGYIPSQRGQRNAAGYYHSTYRKDWPGRPKMIYASDYFSDAVAIEALLDKLRIRGGDWDFKIDCYEMIEIDGKTTTQAAAELGKSQGWISKCANRVKTELAKMGA